MTMWNRLLVRYFLLGTSRLMLLTASYILIVLFSFLSRFSKACLILLGLFHFSWYCECESLSYFFLFFNNFLCSPLMKFNLMLTSFWLDYRCRIFGSLLFFSLWLYPRFFSADVFTYIALFQFWKGKLWCQIGLTKAFCMRNTHLFSKMLFRLWYFVSPRAPILYGEMFFKEP